MEAFFDALALNLEALIAGMTITGLVFLGIFVGLASLLLTFFIRIYIAYRMAKNRHRDPLGWVLLSFFFSPLLTWIILLIVGNDSSH